MKLAQNSQINPIINIKLIHDVKNPKKGVPIFLGDNISRNRPNIQAQPYIDTSFFKFNNAIMEKTNKFDSLKELLDDCGSTLEKTPSINDSPIQIPQPVTMVRIERTNYTKIMMKRWAACNN
jgi:hypothetical protein